MTDSLDQPRSRLAWSAEAGLLQSSIRVNGPCEQSKLAPMPFPAAEPSTRCG